MIILHGEDANKSYGRLVVITNEKKSSNVEIITLDSTDTDITQLRQLLGSSSLFGSTNLIVIKNLFSGQKSKNKDSIISLIAKNQDKDIVIWENKAITATNLKKFSKAKVEVFSISPVIFKFLDSLRPGNITNIHLAWKKLIEEGTEPEFVFAMVSRQIKLLIQAKSGPSFVKLSPYPARIITQQATHFSLEHLLDLYNRLQQIDQKIKTGSGGNTIDNLLTDFFYKV